MRVAIEIFTEVDDQTSVVEKIASITKYIVEMGFRVDSIQAVRLQRYLSDYTEANAMLSNILKKVQSVEEEIIKNLK
jgi:methyl coenzyme M reductase subunit D